MSKQKFTVDWDTRTPNRMIQADSADYLMRGRSLAYARRSGKTLAKYEDYWRSISANRGHIGIDELDDTVKLIEVSNCAKCNARRTTFKCGYCG